MTGLHLHLLKVSVVPAADLGLVAQARHLRALPAEIRGKGDRVDHKLAVSDRGSLALVDHLRAAHLKMGNAVPVVLVDRIVAARRKVDHKVDRHRAVRKVLADRRQILLALSTMCLNSMPTATA